MIKLSSLKEEWLQDPEMKQHYDEANYEFQIAKKFIQARIDSNMTQLDVAKKMNTTQSAIARIESGKSVITTKTIYRFAKALGMNFQINFIAD